jgi:O-antigen ligase
MSLGAAATRGLPADPALAQTGFGLQCGPTRCISGFDDTRTLYVQDSRPGARATPVLNAAAASLATSLLVLIGPVAYLAPMGLTPLVVLAALVSLIAAVPKLRTAEHGPLRRFLRAGVAAWPLLIVGVASVAWSINPSASLYKTGQLVVLIALAAWLVPAYAGRAAADRPRLLATVAWGFLVAAVVVLADLASGGAVTGWARPVPESALYVSYSRGAAVHAIFGLPLGLALWRFGRRPLAVATLIAALMPLALDQVSAQLALIVAALTVVAVLAVPAARWLLLTAQVAMIAAVPLVLPYENLDRLCPLIETKASVVHRVMIWNFALERWAERPLAGWGLATAREVPGGDAYADFVSPCGREVKTLESGRLDLPQLLPLHTHNAAVQVWLELGVVGALALIWLLVRLAGGTFRRVRDRAGQAAVAGLAAASFSVAVVSFGAWQSWWWSAVILAMATIGAAVYDSAGKPSGGAR